MRVPTPRYFKRLKWLISDLKKNNAGIPLHTGRYYTQALHLLIIFAILFPVSCYIERILHGSTMIWILFSNYITEQGNKIHIFKPPCNFIFMIDRQTKWLRKQQWKSGKWPQQYLHLWGYRIYAGHSFPDVVSINFTTEVLRLSVE